MEDHLITTRDEYKVLKKFKARLQKRHHVVINMPDTEEFLEHDVIFVSVVGEMCNIENVKKFLSEKMKVKSEKAESQKKVVLITLSDSEDSVLSSDSESKENSVSVLEELACANNYQNLVEKSSVRNSLDNSVHIIDCTENPPKKSSGLDSLDNSVIIIDCPENPPKKSTEWYCDDNIISIIDCPKNPSKRLTRWDCVDSSISIIDCSKNPSKKLTRWDCVDNSISVIDCPENPPEKSSVCVESSISMSLTKSVSLMDCPKNIPSLQNARGKKRKSKQERLKNKKARIKNILTTAEAEVCEISSTVSDEEVSEVSSTTGETVKKTQQKCEKPADFIPLAEKKDTTRMVLLEKPISAPRPLRPVVIDGSNVAREHGRASNCFSAKGIQLAVEYFINRGHTDVHVFIPKYRRFSNPNHSCPTTDPEILDELAKKQIVIFTPSRRVNGKCIASYDDRFIVELASRNGGVMVSNDNYRDLIEESDSFKESIEKRLLMFCFVKDIFMVPADPLGRNGPSLADFLSFDPECKT